LELLEQSLAKNQLEPGNEKEEDTESEQYLTTAQARQEYRDIYKKARGLAAQNSLLAQQKDAVAHFLAAKHSTLGKFLIPEEASQLDVARYNKAATEKIIQQATQRFVNTNREIITRGIREVAAEAGFTRERMNKQRDGRHYVVMSDASGKAVVAEISVSKQGDIKTNIDLVGYTDNSCHQVMEDLIIRLRDKQILLEQSKRQDHFQILGEILPKLRTRKQHRQTQTTNTPKNKRRAAFKKRRKNKA
jgi:hypothetical protein